MLTQIFAVVLVLAPYALVAQEPFHLSYNCAEDELQAAGLLCTEEEPCAIFLELSSVASAGQKLFLTGNLHATSGTLSSILLTTDDGGSTWKEPAARIRGAALDQIQFYDAQHGWAAGETQYPLARDPFFLTSTDGGATWRQHPLTGDGGPGAVQRFWFDSPQHGELTVDAGRSAPSGRYLSYETDTGGDVWIMRGTSEQPPKIRRAPPAGENPDYRIRAATNGKTYRIEKRSGEKWEVVSSLLIEAASCSIKPPEAKDPQGDAPPVQKP